MNGGDDGTRTRGLCRDRVAGRRNLLELNGTDSPFLILQGNSKELFGQAHRTQIGPKLADPDEAIAPTVMSSKGN